MEKIKHANIIYMPTISPLGGIETYVWELVKKYHDLDIAVVSKTCDPKQARRIKKYCKLYIHTNQEIECKVAIINYDTSIIKYINEDAKIYQTIHGDYSHESYDKMPPKHERITDYIAITKYLQGRMKEVLKTDKVIMTYNPLTIEKEEKPLITLVSATRLNFRKGKGRMIKLAQALDKANVNYIWYVFTNDEESIESPNVIFLKNRLDVSRWIARADYLVQLSDTEACSYAINEMLYRNKPVIVTPLPYLKEIGFENKKNGYVLEFDCSNVQEIVDNIYNIPKFTFKQLEDKYGEIFAPSKSTYSPEKDIGKDVIAIANFTLDNFDEIYNLVRANKYKNIKGHIYVGDRFSCSIELFNYLIGNNKEGIKVVEEIS